MSAPTAFARAVAAALLPVVAACSPASPVAPMALAAAPATAGAPGHGDAWQTTLDSDHPLVGKIWDGRRHKRVGPDDVFAALAAADFVLLGEKHDNPDHHTLQARALRAMIGRGRAPAMVFEMLDEDQQGAVDGYLAAPGATAEGFGAHVAWDHRGWNEYRWYSPIVKAAIDARLPIVAGNLTMKEMRGIVRGGPSSLPPARAKELGLDVELSPATSADLAAEMRIAHCGQLPEAMLAPMVTAQRARDGALGGHMLAAGAAGARTVVLIAGNGHARTDRGVPAFLYARAPGAKVVSVAFLEVEHGNHEPDPEPYDFVWYTPRATDEDPCAKMRR